MSAPTLPVYVDTANGLAQIAALHASITGLGSAIRGVNASTPLTSPLDKLKAQMATDVADIKKMLSGGLAGAFAGGATGVEAGGGVIAKAISQQTKMLQIAIERMQESLEAKAKAAAPLKLVNTDAAADVARIKEADRQVRAAIAAARAGGTPFSTMGGSSVNTGATGKFAEDDFRHMVGMPSRAQALTFSSQLKARLTTEAKDLADLAKASASPAASTLPKLNKDLAAFSLHANDAHAAARGLAGGFGQLWLTYGNLAPLIAGAAVSFTFKQAIKEGAEFEQTLTAIQQLAEVASEDMAKLSTEALRLGATTQYGPNEVAKGLKTLALAGLDAKAQLEAIKPALNFATVGEMPLEAAAESLVAISTAFGYTALGFGAVGDVIAKAAAVSMSSVTDMTAAFRVASTVAQQFGVSVTDASTTLALLAQVGIRGTAAGTAMRNMYNELMGSSKQARKILQETLKVDILDNFTKSVKPLPVLLGELGTALGAYDFKGQLRIIQQLGNERGTKAISATLTAAATELKGAGGDITTILKDLQQKLEDAPGFVATAAAAMALTTENQLKSVGNSLQAALIGAFQSASPAVQQLTADLKNMFQSETFGASVKSLVSSVAELASWLLKNIEIIATIAAGLLIAKGAMLGMQAVVLAANVALPLLGVAYGAVATGASAAAVASRLFTASLGPVGVALAVVTTAWALFGQKGEDASVALGEAERTRLNSTLQGFKDEEQRLLKQIALREGGADAATVAAATEGSLLVASMVTANKAARAFENLAHAKLIAARALFADTPYAQTAQGATALVQLDQKIADSRGKMADTVLSQLKQENEARDQVRRTINAAKLDARQASDEVARVRKDRAVGDRSFSGDDSKKPKHTKENYDKLISLEENYYTKQKQIQDASFSQQQADIKRNLSAREITEGAAYVLSLSNAVAHEQKQLKLIEETHKAEIEKLDKLAKTAGKKEGYDDASQKIKDNYDARIVSLQQLTQARKEASRDDLSKSLSDDSEAFRKAFVDLKTYNEQLEIKAASEKASEGMSDAERGGYEARAEYLAKFVKEQEALAKVLADQRAQLSSIDEALEAAAASGSSAAFTELSASFSRVSSSVEISVEKLKQFETQLASGGAKAAIDGSNKVLIKQFNDLNDKVKNTLTDAIIAGVEGGGQGMKATLTKALKDFAKQKFRITIDAILNPISNRITQYITGGVGGIGGATGAGGGILGMANNASSAYSAAGLANTLYSGGVNGAIATYAGSGSVLGYASGLSTIAPSTVAGANLVGAAGGDALATLIGAQGWTSGIAGGATATGAVATTAGGTLAGGAATGLAAVPVVGWIALAALAAYSIFKKDKVASTSTASMARSYDAAGNITGQETSNSYGNGGAAIDGIYSSLSALRMQLGASGAVGFGFGSHTGNEGEKPEFRLQTPGFDSGLVEQNPENTSLAVNRAVLAALQASEMPKSVAKFFDGLIPANLTAAEIQQVTNNAIAFSNGVKLLNINLRNSSFAALQTSSFDATAALVQVSGGFETLSSNLSGYFDGFYSEAEKRTQKINDITRTLNAGGVGVTAEDIRKMSESGVGRDEFRLMIDAQGAVTEANAPFLAALYATADAFASITPASVRVADAATETAEALEDVAQAYARLSNTTRTAEQQAQTRLDLEGQLLQLTGTADQLRTAAIAGMDAYNVALYDSVQAAQASGVSNAKLEAANAQLTASRLDLERQILTLSGDTVALRLLDIAGMDAANIALFDRIAAMNAEKTANEKAAATTAQLTASRLDLERQILTLSGDTVALRLLDIAGMDAANIALFDRVALLTTEKTATEAAVATAAALIVTNKGWQDQLDVLTGKETARSIALRDTTDESTRALMRQVHALEDLATALTDAKTATTDAFSGVQRAIDAEKKRIQLVLDASQESADSIRGVFTLLRDQVEQLYGTVDSTKGMQSREGNAFIDNALRNAQLTGYLPDQEELSRAIAAARGGLDASEFATQIEADKAALIMAGKLSQLQAIAGPQLSLAEQSVELAKNQLTALDAQLTLAQQQIDAVNNVNTSVLSVAAAMAGLAGAVAAQRAADASVPGQSPREQAPRSFSGSAAVYEIMQRSMSTGAPTAQFDAMGGYDAVAAAYSAGGGQYGRDGAFLASIGIPGYASGGMHMGGARIVGEGGPELEVTGPSRIFNSTDTARMLGGMSRKDEDTAALEAQIAVLTAQMVVLVNAVKEGNKDRRQFTDQFDQVTEGGNGIRTTAI